jgi:4'-phosphopantetheinyl transferase
LSTACQRQRFFDLWTLKEAYVKARGVGLGIPLNSFGFEFDQQARGIKFNNVIDPECTPHWQFWQSRMSSAHTLALAYSGLGGENSEAVPRLQAYRFIPLGPVGPQEMKLAPANYSAT